MIPNNITKIHLEKAIDEIDKQGIRRGRHSSTYDLVHNGNFYPPKLVISIANRFANNIELDSESFVGGIGTSSFKLLEDNGFHIEEKNNSKLIKDFQHYLKNIHKNNSTSNEYIKMMPKIELWFIKKNICNNDFNIWRDIKIITEIDNKLKTDFKKEWKDLNKNEKNWYSAPWNKWVTYNKKTKLNYWVFQGNPKMFDFETALQDEIVTDWTVSAHKDKIKVGDKIILWITGTKSGCYALAEVTSEPHQKTSSPDDYLWKEEDKSELKVDIKITNNLVKNPILKSVIESLEELSELKVGHQGTNFSATEDEYQTILDLISSNNNSAYNSVKNVLDSDLVNDYILFLRNYVNLNQLHPEDNRICFNVRPNKKRLVFIIGSRYALCIEKIKNKTEVSFISKNPLNKESDSFTNHKKEIEAYWNRISNISDFDEFIKEGFDIELARNNKSPFKRFTNKEFIEDIYQTKIIMGQKKNETMTSLNTILYGPPGTGKTFALKQDYFPLYSSKETSISVEKNFESVVKSCSWWEVIAVALIQLGDSKVKDIYNHTWVRKKEELSNSKSVKPTIWGQLQAHTIDECEFVNVKSRQQPFIFNKSKNSRWNIVAEEVENQIPELYDLIDKVENFIPDANKTIKRYKFVTFHQSYSYEDFIEGIKPVMTEDDIKQELGYKIEDGVFKALCEEARNDPGNKYAIFIDEINRGNVSAIFGELITLIEQDKRLGEANEISVQLPYSKTLFSVPANIDIYSTMNTADRSVEALDTALRRRFSFVEMMPDVSLLESKEIDGINLKNVLSTINDRIEILIDRDHTIGHSYFMNINNSKELKLAFKDKIVPLLQEYFYGDYGKIGLVLGEGFVKSHSKSKNPFAAFKYEGKEELNRDFYDLVPIDDTFEIINALENLLNKNKDNQD